MMNSKVLKIFILLFIYIFREIKKIGAKNFLFYTEKKSFQTKNNHYTMPDCTRMLKLIFFPKKIVFDYIQCTTYICSILYLALNMTRFLSFTINIIHEINKYLVIKLWKMSLTRPPNKGRESMEYKEYCLQV